MASYELAPIRRQEPLIVERLRLAFPVQTFALERVPPTLTVAEFKRVVRQAPFLGLAWAGMKPSHGNGRELRGAMQWRLYLICRASNGLEARFKGDRKDIGLDAMTDVALALLHGASLKPVGATDVTNAQSLIADGYADDDIALCQIDFDFTFTSSPADFALRNPDAFGALDLTWQIDGSPGPGVMPGLEELHQT